MVEQPKFYYKVVPMVLEKGVKGMKIRKARYYVSDTLKPGFKVHPAFVENGNVNPYIYLAAFEGSLFDTSANAYILDNAQVADFAADKLSSIAGTKPAGGDTQNLTRANVRLLARKGWLNHCDSYRLRKKYIAPIQEDTDRYYREVVKKKKFRKAA